MSFSTGCREAGIVHEGMSWRCEQLWDRFVRECDLEYCHGKPAKVSLEGLEGNAKWVSFVWNCCGPGIKITTDPTCLKVYIKAMYIVIFHLDFFSFGEFFI